MRSKVTLVAVAVSGLLLSFGLTGPGDKDGSDRGTVTFSEHIAPILYANCTGCHHNGGIAPFSLITYNQAVNNSFMLEFMTSSGAMPPWPPDTSYKRFRHERVLTALEIQQISDWVQNGTPQGDSTLAPPYPTYNSTGPQFGTPDLTLSAPVYASNATASGDDYVCFSIPSGLATDQKIMAVEVEPGNPEIVHHCLVYIDESGTYQTDTSGGCMGPSSASAKLAGEFTPGSAPTVYPSGATMAFGVNLVAGSNIVLAMHYPEGSLDMIDSTKVHFYFYPPGQPGFREITIEPLIQNWSFCVGANQTQTVTAEFPAGAQTIPFKYSAIGIFPHMHLLGTSIKSYGVSAGGDTTKFIDIPEWDFEWQGFYEFKKPQPLPVGSDIFGEGTYDNTTNNPHNPNDPPQTVCAGLNTTDEMFLIYFMYTPYMAGDENLDLDSLSQTGILNIMEQRTEGFNVVAYPNPMNDEVRFLFSLEESNDVTIDVLDINGRLVYSKDYGRLSSGEHRLSWQGVDHYGNPLSAGTYLYQIKAGDKYHYGKVIRR